MSEPIDHFAAIPILELPPTTSHGRGTRSRRHVVGQRARAIGEAELFGAPLPVDEQKKRSHNVNFTQLAYRDLAALGFFAAKTEFDVVGYMGASHKKDLWGFADFVAVKDGRFYAFQVCAENGRTAHIRKIASGAKIKGFPHKTIRENAEAFLSGGGRLFLLIFEQPGGYGSRWESRLLEVTLDTLAEVDSRRRGPRR